MARKNGQHHSAARRSANSGEQGGPSRGGPDQGTWPKFGYPSAGHIVLVAG